MRIQEGRLTHEEFFKVCEQIRNDREMISSQISTRTKLAAHLTTVLNFKVSEGTVATALKMTGVPLVDAPRNSPKSPTSNSSRTLARALVQLYRNLGETPPEALTQLLAAYDCVPTPASPPVPVAAIKDTKNIRIAH